MFEDVRRAFNELLNGNVAPEDRRDALSGMRDTIVHARMALDDLRSGIEATRTRLKQERTELETIRRRKTLAEGINDTETVQVATRFETLQGEKVAVMEKKLEAQEGELAIAEREVEEMKAQFKAASAGVGSGLRAGGPGTAGGGMPSDAELGLGRDPGLGQEIDSLDRARRRAASEADADARLAELKRRMGL
jgi:hypothetical protein